MIWLELWKRSISYFKTSLIPPRYFLQLLYILLIMHFVIRNTKISRVCYFYLLTSLTLKSLQPWTNHIRTFAYFPNFPLSPNFNVVPRWRKWPYWNNFALYNIEKWGEELLLNVIGPKLQKLSKAPNILFKVIGFFWH